MKTEWIKCSDRLPERGQEVLAYNENFNCYEVTSYNYYLTDKYEPVGELFKKLEVSNLMWQNNEVTHWMPLPEPPTE